MVKDLKHHIIMLAQQIIVYKYLGKITKMQIQYHSRNLLEINFIKFKIIKKILIINNIPIKVDYQFIK